MYAPRFTSLFIGKCTWDGTAHWVSGMVLFGETITITAWMWYKGLPQIQQIRLGLNLVFVATEVAVLNGSISVPLPLIFFKPCVWKAGNGRELNWHNSNCKCQKVQKGQHHYQVARNVESRTPTETAKYQSLGQREILLECDYNWSAIVEVKVN